jgi:hypothetical protein
MFFLKFNIWHELYNLIRPDPFLSSIECVAIHLGASETDCQIVTQSAPHPPLSKQVFDEDAMLLSSSPQEYENDNSRSLFLWQILVHPKRPALF